MQAPINANSGKSNAVQLAVALLGRFASSFGRMVNRFVIRFVGWIKRLAHIHVDLQIANFRFVRLGFAALTAAHEK